MEYARRTGPDHETAHTVYQVRGWLTVIVPPAFIVLCAVPFILFIVFFPDPWATPTLNYFYPYFDLDEEANVATWFSSTLLLFCSLVCMALVRLSPRSDIRARLLAAGGASLFLFLSMDETGRLHELLDRMLAHRIVNVFYDVPATARVWAVFALPILALLGYALFRVVRANMLHLRAGSRAFVAGFCAWGLSLLIEFTLGPPLWKAQMLRLYRLEVLVEESAEMAGTFLILLGLLRALESHLRSMGEEVERGSPA